MAVHAVPSSALKPLRPLGKSLYTNFGTNLMVGMMLRLMIFRPP